MELTNDFQANSGEGSTPPSSSDSTLATSAGSTPSSAPPATAETLVNSFFEQAQAPSVEGEPASSDAPPATVPPPEANAADSAVSPAEEQLGYQSLDEAIRDIRGLRENKKALEIKAKGYDAFLGQFEQIGLTPDLIEPNVQLLGNLLTIEEDAEGNPVRTTNPFFDNLEQSSQPLLRQLLGDVVSRYPSYLLDLIGREKALQHNHLTPSLYDTYAAVNPDGTLNGQTVGGYDPEILNSIPAPLRETYKQLPVEDQYELDAMTPERRAYKLQEKYELAEMRREQQAQKEAAQQASLAAQAEVKERRLHAFIAEQESAFMTELAQAFSPLGNDPAKAHLNHFFHQAIHNEVSRALESDPKTAKILQALGHAARENDGIARQQLLAQINVHVAKHRNKIIEDLNAEVFSPAFRQAAQVRQQNANHTNVNGAGGFSANHHPQSLPDINSPDYLEQLAARVGFHLT